MSQGLEANHGGRWLEDIVEREFKARGFLVRYHGDDQDNTDLFNPNRLIKNAPYTSIYGCDSRSEFLAISDSRKRAIRIECRKQDVPGSVDEKFPYLLANAAGPMPENEVLLLIGGEGARCQAMDWLKRSAATVAHKKIWVLTLNEFPLWVRREFANLKIA